MDELLPQGIQQLASQGTGWLIACFLGSALVWLYLRTTADREKHEGIRDGLQEKRVTEAAATVRTLDQATKAMLDTAAAHQAEVEARASVIQLLQALDRDMERNHESWKPQVAEIVRLLGEIKKGLDELKSALPARGGK